MADYKGKVVDKLFKWLAKSNGYFFPLHNKECYNNIQFEIRY